MECIFFGVPLAKSIQAGSVFANHIAGLFSKELGVANL